jgi:uncharacterized DUF497 family protein
LLVDTGFLVALYIRGDTLHQAALAYLRQNQLPLQTASPVIVETCFFLDALGKSFAFLIIDPDHSLEEERYLLLGMSIHQRLLVVAFAERSSLTRIISARRANRIERKKYEEGQ